MRVLGLTPGNLHLLDRWLTEYIPLVLSDSASFTKTANAIFTLKSSKQMQATVSFLLHGTVILRALSSTPFVELSIHDRTRRHSLGPCRAIKALDDCLNDLKIT